MRRRLVALGACTVALALAAAPAAPAQDAPVEPADPAAAEAPPAAEAAPDASAPPAQSESVGSAGAVESAGSVESIEPAEPAEPAEIAEPAEAAPPAAPTQAASPEPPPAAAAAPPRARAAVPAKGRVRPRPRPAPNMSQADVQVSEFEGRVTVGDVAVRGCGDESCAGGQADYEVRDLEVRAEAGGPALLTVSRAQVTGAPLERSVTARVVIQPPGEQATEGEVELLAGLDLLRPEVFDGTSLEAAYRRLVASSGALLGPGGALERLTIVFGEGNVIDGSFGAVSISAADQLVTVNVPVRAEGGTLVRDGDLVVERRRTDSMGTRLRRETSSRRALGDVVEGRPHNGGGGGGGGAVVGEQREGEEPESDDGSGSGLFGTITSVCVLGVGACRRDDEEPVARFVVDARSTTITIDDSGRGTLEIGCPAGFSDVRGLVVIESEIRLGERQRRLAEDTPFACDRQMVSVEFHLRPPELDRLRDASGPVTVRVTVRVTAEGGLRSVDFDLVALQLAG